ncbi:MAG: response regulator, partial [Actinobacteria bacterium]|nr:response regulator [Actinomycetota bacterium]
IQAATADEHPIAHPARAPTGDVGHPPPANGAAVLVVEDTPVNQVVATRVLEKSGYRAQVAENGRKALEAMSQRDYAAVLMDLQMPELDGYETTREIRRREQDGRRVPIIAMTANSMNGERERCLAAGMDDYMTKPLRSQTLKETLARWVSGAAAAAVDVSGSGAARHDAEGILDEEVVDELENLDRAALADILTLYVEQAARYTSELSAAVADGDALAVAQTAHKLKGSSRTVGAARSSRIASELEEQADSGDLSAAHELLERLAGALEDTTSAFRDRGTRLEGVANK